MKCPYDPAHDNTTKPTEHGARYYAKCQICGRKARAVVYSTNENKTLYELVRIGKNPMGDEVKRVRSVRLSDREIEAVERGTLRLIIVNKRITLSV